MLTPLQKKETGLYSKLIDDAVSKAKVINEKGTAQLELYFQQSCIQ
jgi:hypothetical protein